VSFDCMGTFYISPLTLPSPLCGERVPEKIIHMDEQDGQDKILRRREPRMDDARTTGCPYHWMFWTTYFELLRFSESADSHPRLLFLL